MLARLPLPPLLLVGILATSGPASAGGYLWFGCEFVQQDKFYRYDIDAGMVDLVVTPGGSGHNNNMATDGAFLYVGNPSTQALRVRDMYTGARVADHVYDQTLGGVKEDGAFHAATGNLWRNSFSNNIYETTRDGQVLNTYNGAGAQVGLEWVGETLYSTNYSGGAIGTITFAGTTATFTAIPWSSGGVPVGSLVGLAYDKQDDVLYMASLFGVDAKLYTVTFAGGEATATFLVDVNTVGFPNGGLIDGMGWVPPETFSYCTAKTNSCGTLPSIDSDGLPSATAGSGFDVRATNARGTRAGLLIYTDGGPANPPIPFQGGLLCISAPIKRTIPVFDTTGTPGQCDGVLEIDMNAFAVGALGGNPLPSLTMCGATIDCQFWARDTVANGSLLSDALEYVVRP